MGLLPIARSERLDPFAGALHFAFSIPTDFPLEGHSLKINFNELFYIGFVWFLIAIISVLNPKNVVDDFAAIFREPIIEFFFVRSWKPGIGVIVPVPGLHEPPSRPWL